MAAKRSFKLETHRNRKHNLGSLVAGAILGVSVLGTFGHIKAAFKSLDSQQLIPLQSEIFHSSKYQPIIFGSTAEIARQDFTNLDRIAKELNYSGDSI